ncbi:histidine kinase/DNA gyrase B/HSP90-like ATPase [Roseimicrobium gellanilyticum]|uniref:histidine kinase n=1 Tax=Roseimicrobium gellanilyticum TaxID=748857 RepID=A0A366HPE0_9BACT|nr:ATP-binding protein [Roseimicrobium gellanilyticum]RBP45380.1 histidine kinase/DNA gyrase B/HSP90-like ATPase [Roseimicrobium gellanilyticum]
MMPRFASTLQFRLSAILLLFGAALVVSNHVMQLRREEEVRRKSLELLAYSDGTRMSGVVQHLLARSMHHAVDLEMSYVSATPDLVRGVISDQHDVVQHSSKRQWTGLPLDSTPLRIARPLMAKARQTMQGQIHEVDPGKRYLSVFPYLTGNYFTEKGLVIMEYDLARAIAEARAHALNQTISRSFLLLAACLLLWLLLQHLVTSRVQQLISQAKAVGTGAPLPEPLRGNDELARISRSFLEASTNLRDTETQLQKMMENLRDVFWMAPLKKPADLSVNDAYEVYWNRSRTRLVTHRWDWLHAVPKEERRRLLLLLRDLQQGGESAEVELRLVHAGKPARWLQVRAFVVKDHRNEPYALAGFAFDVTERKTVDKQLLQAAEEERRRIGSDLHDDVCQRLAAAKLKSGVLRKSLVGAHLPQAELAGELASDLALANNLVRGFARGLMPVASGVEDLSPAIQELSRFITSSFQVPCVVHCSEGISQFDPEMSTHVYRIAQELAVNAAKHAQATRIQINLVQDDRMLRLEVLNDGVAFPASPPRNAGMGLHMVQRRVEVLGASISFQPRPGGGTKVVCEVPVASLATGSELAL